MKIINLHPIAQPIFLDVIRKKLTLTIKTGVVLSF